MKRLLLLCALFAGAAGAGDWPYVFSTVIFCSPPSCFTGTIAAPGTIVDPTIWAYAGCYSNDQLIAVEMDVMATLCSRTVLAYSYAEQTETEYIDDADFVMFSADTIKATAGTNFLGVWGWYVYWEGSKFIDCYLQGVVRDVPGGVPC